MGKFKVGDVVRPKKEMIDEPCRFGGTIREDWGGAILSINGSGHLQIRKGTGITWFVHEDEFELVSEVNNVDLKDIKPENLAEAKTQYDTEKKNAEIEYAKQQLRNAVDKRDEIDRKIKALNEERKPFDETIAKFG